MAWYWIVLIVIGDFIVGGFIARIYVEKSEDDGPASVILALFWPIALPIFIALGIGYIVADRLLNKKR